MDRWESQWLYKIESMESRHSMQRINTHLKVYAKTISYLLPLDHPPTVILWEDIRVINKIIIFSFFGLFSLRTSSLTSDMIFGKTVKYDRIHYFKKFFDIETESLQLSSAGVALWQTLLLVWWSAPRLQTAELKHFHTTELPFLPFTAATVSLPLANGMLTHAGSVRGRLLQ